MPAFELLQTRLINVKNYDFFLRISGWLSNREIAFFQLKASMYMNHPYDTNDRPRDEIQNDRTSRARVRFELLEENSFLFKDRLHVL